MPPIKIVRQSQQSQLTASGQVQQMIRVDYMVGNDGPFSLSIPQSEFSADVLHQQILAAANQHVALRAKFEP